MANLFKTETGLLHAFIGQLAKADLTAEMIEAANRDPSIALAMVAAARDKFGVLYERPTAALKALRKRLALAGVKDRFKWVGPSPDTHAHTKQPGACDVIVAHLGSPDQTLAFAYDWNTSQHAPGWVTDRIASQPWIGDQALFFGGCGFEPWTLRIVTIGLHNRYPNSNHAPGCALLYMCAQHSAVIEAVDNLLMPGISLPGITTTVACGSDWTNATMRVARSSHLGRSEMTTEYDSMKSECSTVPVLLA